ncbi:RidA family protein [Microbacterium sp. 18062]|uniref:RidA family protein n=1 Tax=Microbacterium sp. 18062 TaxID=2681410 RepID=UPI00135AAEB9|nr:RidA family protein [Microbacterium sp. 18062]
MSKKAYVSSALPAPAGAYSHVVEVRGIVYTAGFGPQDPQTGEVPETVAEQTRGVLRNLSAALAVVGMTLADVVKTTVHLADLADFTEFDAAYEEIIPAPFPVRTTVGSQLAGILVEIDAVAIRDQEDAF